jgi:hypothetical protein
LDHGLSGCWGFETVELLQGKYFGLILSLNVEGQDIFVWHLAQNLLGMGGHTCSFVAPA